VSNSFSFPTIVLWERQRNSGTRKWNMRMLTLPRVRLWLNDCSFVAIGLFVDGQRNVPFSAVWLCLTLFLTQVSMLLWHLSFFIFKDVFCACYPFIEWFYKFCFCDKLKTLNHQNTNYLAAHYLLLTYSIYWPWPQIFGINNAGNPQC